MAKMTDLQIKAWIKNNERFEGRSDGDGLYMSYRETFAVPVWRFRYKLKGATRWVTMGSYSDLSVAEARRQAKELRASVALGYDVAEEKQERKTAAINKIESKKTHTPQGNLLMSIPTITIHSDSLQSLKARFQHEQPVIALNG